MIKRILAVAVATLGLCVPALGQYVTLQGTLASSNSMPASNYVISFTLSQFGYISGTGVVVNTATTCATSTDGSTVGVPNPLIKPPVTVGFTGTLPPANYYVKFAFYDAAANVTLVSPETVIQLNSTGRLIVAAPTAGIPYGATGMKVYISTTSGTETLQGSSTGSAAYLQTIPLVTGAAVPSSNTTICKQIANDAIWPTGTGYTVAMTDPSGNTIPGYPMMWQLMGPNTTINLSNGLPYYHGTVYFPTPILASPLNHALQSISGPLSLSGYNLINVGSIGVGTTLPAWAVDVENGAINSQLGYLINGSGGSAGQCIGSDGTYFNTLLTCIPIFSARFLTTTVSGVTHVDLNAPGTGNIVPTETADPGTTTGIAVYDGAKNIVPAPVQQSVTGNGYYTLPGGLIEEWGEVTAQTGPSHVDIAPVSFPLAFPNAVFSCVATVNSDNPTSGWSAVTTMIRSRNLTTISISLDTTQTSIGFSNMLPVDWHCIGN